MRNFIEQWSVTQQTRALFARSKIYQRLVAKRTEVTAVVWQLRRWLPLCKLLSKDEASSSLLLLVRLHSGSGPPSWWQRYCTAVWNPTKERWMQKRGAALRLRIEAWIQVQSNVLLHAYAALRLGCLCRRASPACPSWGLPPM
jgi:hypothetical protein